MCQTDPGSPENLESTAHLLSWLPLQVQLRTFYAPGL